MFEKPTMPLAPQAIFRQRVLKYFFYSALMLGVSLGIGMVGYAYFADLPWIDAFYNAAMILTGMGPVNLMPTTAAKVFSGFYALFSGIAFLSTTAVLFTPIAHRFLHLMQLDEGDD